MGLYHQTDTVGGVFNDGYSQGDTHDSDPAPGYQAERSSGPGTYGPVMSIGQIFGQQRGALAVALGGGSDVPANQNDVKTILSSTQNPGLTMADSGKGHTFGTATALPVIGDTVDVNNPAHRGIISPTSASDPQPLGISNYSKDYFSFLSDGLNPITLTANDGDDLLTPGVADPNATLRSKLNIYDLLGGLIGTATEDPSTLFETYSGLLLPGLYYAEITSFGGHVEISDPAFDPKHYYDMGGYFLTGSGMVPEPGSLSLLGIGLLAVAGRRKR